MSVGSENVCNEDPSGGAGVDATLTDERDVLRVRVGPSERGAGAS
jgi:hypothetical protein